MSSNMKQLEVQIMGQSYLLACPDGGQQRLLDAVEKVDTAMCKIRDAGKVKARDRIAVLAALNLAFALAERAESPATPARAAGADDSATEVTTSTVDVAQLIKRIDMALGADGQLL